MKGSAKGTITDTVRNFCSAHGTVRRQQIHEALGYSLQQVGQACDNLVRTGELVRIDRATYRVNVPEPPASPMGDRIWRIMRMSPTFTMSEIERLSGASSGYCAKVIKRYRACRLVAKAGMKKGLTGQKQQVWRLTLSGRQHIERPEVEAFTPDPLLVKTVQLNRLICTGLALANDDDRGQAERLCKEILESLGEICRESAKNGEEVQGG